LVEFEEAVIRDGGCWLTLVKAVPSAAPAPAATDAKGKAAPAKGKAPPADDLKPVIGRAWVSLEKFMTPGSTKTVQRINLETVAPAVKETTPEGVEKYVDSAEPTPVFEDSKTYIHCCITLSNPVTPVTPSKPEPRPNEIIPLKKLVKWPFSKNPNDDFSKQVAIAVKALTREYF
jgi:hypothetical protein